MGKSSRIGKQIFKVVKEIGTPIIKEFAREAGKRVARKIDDDNFTGNKKREYFNGSVYTGDFVEGKRHGKGRTEFADGGFYEGEYSNDKRHGKGKSRFSNGNEYEGDWLNGEYHGNGRLVLANGKVLEGRFANGKFIDDYYALR